MATWYLNKNAITQNGKTPETGYNKFRYLIDAQWSAPDGLKDGDTIEFVTDIDDRGEYGLDLGGFIFKPHTTMVTWDLAGNWLGENWNRSTVIIQDLHIKNLSFDINKYLELGTPNYIITRCWIENSALRVTDDVFYAADTTGYITNCIFSGAEEGETNFYIRIDAVSHTLNTYINNNVFYGGDTAIKILGVNYVTGKILNNIFSGQTGYTITSNVGTSPDLTIDYNDFFGANADVNTIGYIGSHQITTDPKFTASPPTTPANFRILISSPCVNTGIAHESDPSVPTVDYANAIRLTADIGAYDSTPFQGENYPSFLITDFFADYLTGPAPLTITFTNNVQGWPDENAEIQAYHWNFGDGGESTAANPTHTFTTPGTYDVTFTITRNFISTSSTQTFIITAVSRYWVNNTSGVWDNTSNWSTSSGGSSGASVPASSTGVFFDSSGIGLCTVNTDASVQSLSMTDGTMDFNGNTFSIANSCNISENALILKSGLNNSLIHIGGNFSLVGKSSSYMDLLATASWRLTVDGDATAQYVNVANSNASYGSTVDATHCGDGEFNLNWNFHYDPVGLNFFRMTPLRNSRRVVSDINAPVLLADTAAAGGGDYFDSTTKMSRVDLTFYDSNSREKKTIIHIGGNLEGRESWTPNSTSGTWRLTQVRVRDTDGAELFIDRSILGDIQDFTLA
jgi:PKD repeat protein